MYTGRWLQPIFIHKLARRLAHGGFEHGAEGAVAGVAAERCHMVHRGAARQQGQGVGQHRLLTPLLEAGAQLGAEQPGHGAFTRANVHRPFGQCGPRQDAGVIGLVGLAHMISHFSQLLLPPLFPWLKEAFNASYTELGFLMTIFFVVSCITQTLSGFVVDRFGPRPILFAGLTLLGLAAFGFSVSTSYWMMACFSTLAGVGNGVFHPVDYTLLNRKVSASRLGHAYSTHGITGSLGWVLAPAMLVPIALTWSWREALMAAGALAFVVQGVLIASAFNVRRARRTSLIPA